MPRWLPTNAPNRLRGMNMSTIAVGVIAGRVSLVSTCLCRLAAVLLNQPRGRLLAEAAAGLQHVHHQQAERGRDRHVDEEQRERASRERPQVRQLAELHDPVRERREHQRDHDEEQHAQEHLPERVAAAWSRATAPPAAAAARTCRRPGRWSRRRPRAPGRAGCGLRVGYRCLLPRICLVHPGEPALWPIRAPPASPAAGPAAQPG